MNWTFNSSPRLTLARFGAMLGWCALAVSCSSPRPVPRPAVVPSPRVRPALPVPDQVGPRIAAARPEDEDDDVVRAVLDAHNAERSRKRLPPLTLDPELTAAAEAHAADMARRGRMAHEGGDGSSPFDRIDRVGYSFQAAGENVAFGFDRVDAVMAGWMRSPGHRRNILGRYTEIGVGRAIAPAGASYWCVTFGTPAGGDLR